MKCIEARFPASISDATAFASSIIILNNVYLPCISLAMFRPECFLNVWQAPPPIKSTYRLQYCVFIDSTTNDCIYSIDEAHWITFVPPYAYSFQCSSTLIESYAGVFFFTVIIIGFVNPALALLMVIVHKYCHHDSCIFKTFSYILIDTVIPQWPTLTMNDSSSDQLIIFDQEEYCISILTIMSIILTYGVVFPPLCFAGVIVIYIDSFFTQYRIARLISQLEQRQDSEAKNKMKEDFLKQCENFSKSLSSSIRLLPIMMSIYLAPFVFDPMGDAIGSDRAWWVLVVMIAIPSLGRVLISTIVGFVWRRNDRRVHTLEAQSIP